MEQLFFFVSLAIFLAVAYVLRQRLGGNVYESSFFAVAMAFAWLIVTSLLLARLGHHYLWLVSAGLLLAAVAMLLFSRTRPLPQGVEAADLKSFALPALAVAVALFHALYPTYYLLGGRDPGLYLIYAVVIGKTGGLEMVTSSALLAEYGLQGFGYLAYPGLYDPVHRGFAEESTFYIAQFHHAFSAFAAIFYEVAGLDGVVRTNAILSFFTLWSFGEVIRRIVGTRLAIFGVIFLGLNVAFAWNARITLTETMSLTSVFAGLAFLLEALKRADRLWPALFAGLLLSLSVLTRIDGVLISGLLVALVLVYERNDGHVRRVLVTVGTVYFVLSGLALLDAWLHSRAYYQDLWRHGSAKSLVAGHIGTAIVYMVLIWLRGKQSWKVLDGALNSSWRISSQVAAAVCFALFAYLYFIYPDKNPADFGHRAFREMSWYSSLALFVGAPLALWCAARKSESRMPVILIAFFIAVTVLFSLKPAISPDHIWASRRWVPLVLPGLILSTFVWIGLTRKPFQHWVLLAVTLVYAATLFPYASNFYFKSILNGYRESYAEAAAKLHVLREQADLAFFSTDGWTASILRFVYDVPVVYVGDRRARNLLNFGAPSPEGVYYLGGAGLRARFTPLVESRVCGDFLQKKRAARPDGLYERCYGIYAYKIDQLDARQREMVLPVSPDMFFSKVGEWQGSALTSTGVKGWLLFGPYTSLIPGAYQITWSGEFDCGRLDSVLVFQVAANLGKKVIVTSKDFGSQICSNDGSKSRVSLHFETPEQLYDVEYRIYVQEDVQVTLEGVRVERLEETGE